METHNYTIFAINPRSSYLSHKILPDTFTMTFSQLQSHGTSNTYSETRVNSPGTYSINRKNCPLVSPVWGHLWFTGWIYVVFIRVDGQPPTPGQILSSGLLLKASRAWYEGWPRVLTVMEHIQGLVRGARAGDLQVLSQIIICVIRCKIASGCCEVDPKGIATLLYI